MTIFFMDFIFKCLNNLATFCCSSSNIVATKYKKVNESISTSQGAPGVVVIAATIPYMVAAERITMLIGKMTLEGN